MLTSYQTSLYFWSINAKLCLPQGMSGDFVGIWYKGEFVMYDAPEYEESLMS